MASVSSMNRNNAAVKRIMQEARELANDPSTDYLAAPLEDDIFEWHCTIRGPEGTEFEGGLYHVRILLPAEYPFRPPSLMVLTPNGRFELNTKATLQTVWISHHLLTSVSHLFLRADHEELWQPAWGVRTAILGLQGFFPLKGQAAVGVGSIEFPPAERKRLAALSRTWCCPTCQQSNLELLPDPVTINTDSPTTPPSQSPQLSQPSPAPIETEHSSPTSNVLTAPQTTGEVESMPTLDVSSSTAQPPEAAPPGPAITAQYDNQGAQSPSSRPTTDSGASSTRVQPVTHSTLSQSITPSSRPPLMLDTAIGVILVLVFALICRRIF
ncbi:hypothetical protein VNI00_008292 [Paramarasmius palmivorus]|uniref:UBC core domain-containing protein n=1 Tax=Paramarasmius palmivorus TaxID=297713 RepID=A0AAW0CX72_9AGAR